jgi:hypothetical protein
MCSPSRVATVMQCMLRIPPLLCTHSTGVHHSHCTLTSPKHIHTAHPCPVPHRFVRAPPEYYDRPLEFRRDILQAASTHHLCKSIIMENTRAHPSVQGCEDPNNSKYYLVIVQVRLVHPSPCACMLAAVALSSPVSRNFTTCESIAAGMSHGCREGQGNAWPGHQRTWLACADGCCARNAS